MAYRHPLGRAAREAAATAQPQLTLPQPSASPQVPSAEPTTENPDAPENAVPGPPAPAADPSQTESDTQASETDTSTTATDTDAQEATKPAASSRAGITWTTDAQKLALIAAVESGISARAAATSVGVNIRTAYDVLAKAEDDHDALRLATQRILAAGAVDAIEGWRTAIDVGARKKGNHAPAKDWLLYAGAIDPLQTDAPGGVRVAIIIGTDERPMRLASPLTVADHDSDNEG